MQFVGQLGAPCHLGQAQVVDAIILLSVEADVGLEFEAT